jgi:hypothetical protein
VPHQEEQCEGEAPESDELGMRAGHAVALTVDAARAFLLDDALKDEVEGLAGELASEG